MGRIWNFIEHEGMSPQPRAMLAHKTSHTKGADST